MAYAQGLVLCKVYVELLDLLAEVIRNASAQRLGISPSILFGDTLSDTPKQVPWTLLMNDAKPGNKAKMPSPGNEE